VTGEDRIRARLQATIDSGEFDRALQMVMLAGAARAAVQGDPAALERLCAAAERAQPLIALGHYDQAEAELRSVMPAGWEPGPGWELQP
jgi:hypothetical protein